MKPVIFTLILATAFLVSCAPVEMNPPVPVFDTGVDPDSWALIPAGTFFRGQAEDVEEISYDYEIMVTDVTVTQYVEFLNAALSDGTIKDQGDGIVGFYPGDVFLAAKHELEIKPGDYILVPTNDPSSRYIYDGTQFSVISGWENHPVTNVSWFGAWTYCGYYGGRLPAELEWEKAARGTEDARPFPWGDEITRSHANFYASRDPFEDMSSYGSLTTPVGFYNGQVYAGYATENGSSPYGLVDMAGNVWQWVGDVIPQFSDRFMRGGSKGTYEMDLRIWVRNSAPPMYFSPSVGFRCVRLP